MISSQDILITKNQRYLWISDQYRAYLYEKTRKKGSGKRRKKFPNELYKALHNKNTTKNPLSMCFAVFWA